MIRSFCLMIRYDKILLSIALKVKFSIKDFFSKCHQIRSFLRIWSHLLKISLMDNFIFCAVESPNFLRYREAVTIGVLGKKVFLEISQNPQENTCVRVLFFNKVTGVSPATLLKKRLWHRRFPVNFVKFLKHHFYRTPLDDCFWTYLYLSLHLLTTEKNQSKRFSRPF